MTTDLDQAFTRIERLANLRDLPGVERSHNNSVPALTVGGASFASMPENDVLLLLCPAEQKALLMEISPDVYFETQRYVGQDAVLVRLDAISDEELALRLEDAWRNQAPPALLEQHPTEPPHT